MHLAFWDWLIIAVYVMVVVSVGLRAVAQQHTSEGYFLAGRQLRWLFIGSSIYAANISAEHFVGLAGAVFCAFLKTLNPLLLVLLGFGLIAKSLVPHLERADDAFPALLKNLMPTGLLGVTVAGLTAALMGHLSATYNSIATLFTRDLYLEFHPAATQERQILAGRVASVCPERLSPVAHDRFSRHGRVVVSDEMIPVEIQ
jgi:Na+/proline symporter